MVRGREGEPSGRLAAYRRVEYKDILIS